MFTLTALTQQCPADIYLEPVQDLPRLNYQTIHTQASVSSNCAYVVYGLQIYDSIADASSDSNAR